MTPKRKQVQDYILKYIGAIVKGKENVKLYEDLFNSMDDEAFHNFMIKLKNQEVQLCVVVPTDGKVRVSIENNLRIAKELGHEFFQRVKVTNHPDYPDHILPNKMLTLILPIRRAQQLLSKKISIPEHNMTIDQLTGQVAGSSRAGKLTYPEQQMLLAMGMKATATEIAKIRGGDQGAAKELNDRLYKDGSASQAEVLDAATGVTSTETLKQYLQGMHIRSTL